MQVEKKGVARWGHASLYSGIRKLLPSGWLNQAALSCLNISQWEWIADPLALISVVVQSQIVVLVCTEGVQHIGCLTPTASTLNK